MERVLAQGTWITPCIAHSAISLQRREGLIRDLKAYCAQDTLGLVHIARYLEGRDPA